MFFGFRFWGPFFVLRKQRLKKITLYINGCFASITLFLLFFLLSILFPPEFQTMRCDAKVSRQDLTWIHLTASLSLVDFKMKVLLSRL